METSQVGYISGFNIVMAILGGFLIALSTSINLLLKGRITGMSGIFYSLVTFDKSSFYWKLSLVSGMLSAASILYLSCGDEPIHGKNALNYQDQTYIFSNNLLIVAGLNLGGFFIAGLLVGFGTKVGNGCTSGHGVCGMPRLAIRSWVAVGTFMLCGIAMSTFRYHVNFLGSNDLQAPDVILATNYVSNAACILSISLIIFFYLCYSQNDTKDMVISFVVGFIFTLGLGFGGMLQRTKIAGFLTFYEGWDPQLLILFVSAVGFNFAFFHYIIRIKQQPIYAEKFQIPNNKKIDWQLVLGAAVFGLGWGLGALCPGPAINLFTQFNLQISVIWILGLFFGQILGAQFSNYFTQQNPSNQQITTQNEKIGQNGILSPLIDQEKAQQ